MRKSECGMRKDGVASLCLLKNKIDRIPYFDIRYSLFDKLHEVEVSFSIKLSVSVTSGWADVLIGLGQVAGNPPLTQF